MFNNDAAEYRLQDAASAWQQNDPKFQQLLDVVSKTLYSRPSSMLSPADSRLLSKIVAMAQNSLPFMANTIPGFISVNRALTTGAIPITAVDHNTGQLQTSYSYGTGNVSTTAASSVLRAFELNMMSGGALDIQKTHGLEADMRAQLTAAIIAKNGVRPGSFYSYDLSEVRSSKGMQEMIDYMRQNGAAESSLQSAKDVKSALSYYERVSGLDSTAISSMSSYDLEASLEKHLSSVFDESIIRQASTVLQGKATNFQVVQEKFNKELANIYDKVAENIKDLSDLFQTTDMNKIQSYARGMGLGDVTDASSAQAVKSQLRAINIESTITGKSVQEIGAQRLQISSGLSALNGGKPAHADTVTRIARAGMGDRNGRAYTSEESMSRAIVSQAAYENEMRSFATFGGLIAEGFITDREAIAEFSRLEEMARGATNLNELRAITAKADPLMEKYGSGFSDVIKADVMTKHGHKFKGSIYDRALIGTNVERGIDNYLSNAGVYLTDEQRARAISAGKGLMRFGNNEAAIKEFFRLLGEGAAKDQNGFGSSNEAYDHAIAHGFSQEDAEKLIADTKASGFRQDQLPSAYGSQSGGWVQQFAPDKDLKAMNTAFINKFWLGNSLADKGELDAGGRNAFMQGVLKEKRSLSDSEASKIIASDIVRRHKYNGTDPIRELDKQGILTLGKWDDKQQRLTFTEDQRSLWMSLLGITEEEEFNKLAGNAEAFNTKLNEAGYSVIQGETSTDGSMLVIDNKKAAEHAAQLSVQMDESGVRVAAELLGPDAVSFTSEGPVITYNGKRVRNIDAFYNDLFKDDHDGTKRARAVGTGDRKSRKYWDAHVKWALNEALKGLHGKGKNGLYDRLAAFAKKDELTDSDYQELQELLKYINPAAFRDKASGYEGLDNALVREGILTRDGTSDNYYNNDPRGQLFFGDWEGDSKDIDDEIIPDYINQDGDETIARSAEVLAGLQRGVSAVTKDTSGLDTNSTTGGGITPGILEDILNKITFKVQQG